MSAFLEYKFPWEPITPRGVVALARAKFWRIFLLQTMLAAVTAVVMVWLLDSGFFPTITAAIRQLPAAGEISCGRLQLPGDTTPRLLAEGHFLAFILDPKHGGQIRSPAQFQFEFGERSLRIFSLFGEAEIVYPTDLAFSNYHYRSFYFNRTDLLPMWGAWVPEILFLAALAVFFGLLLAWWLLAGVYFLPVWLTVFFANRDLRALECWRLAAAALFPGALLMTFSIWLYGFGVLDPIQLCFAFGMHLLTGWIYLFVSPFFARRQNLPALKKNPFAAKP